MNNYSLQIEVEEGKVKEILDRLTKAQEEIYECYREFVEIGVLVIKKVDDKSHRPES